MFNFFKRIKNTEEPKRIKAITTVHRPIQEIQRISNDELMRIRNKKQSGDKVDPYFLQEIVDRMCGGESDDYKNALIDLNNRFKPRTGKTGPSIYI
jgi:GTP1/Obg family GTP-binding protein